MGVRIVQEITLKKKLVEINIVLVSIQELYSSEVFVSEYLTLGLMISNLTGFNRLQLSHYFFLLVDGSWSDWNNWGTCSQTCGNGTTSRTRTCTKPTPVNGGRNCSGNDKEVRSCNDKPCASKYTRDTFF